MADHNLTEVQLEYFYDLLHRMNLVLNSPGWSQDQKIVTVTWLVKQALKAECDKDCK